MSEAQTDHAAAFALAGEIAAERYPNGTTDLRALAECVREAQRRLSQRPVISQEKASA